MYEMGINFFGTFTFFCPRAKPTVDLHSTTLGNYSSSSSMLTTTENGNKSPHNYSSILGFFFNFWKISFRKMIRCSSLFSPWNFGFFGHHLETEIDQIEVIIPSLIKAHKLFDLGAVWIKVLVNMADKSYFLGIWQPHHNHKAIVPGWKCMNAFRQYSSN